MNDASNAPARLPIDELLLALASSRDGLSSEEAARRLARYGANEPRNVAHRSLLFAVAKLFTNPLVVILLLAAVVSGFLGDRAGAGIIIAIVALSITLNFALSFRSERAAARLREEIAPMATVCRDGHWADLPRRALVPGDIIRLSAGDRVPADARLIESRDLHIQQAALTGESVPVKKEASEQGNSEHGPAADHLVFLGTSVVAGAASALVTATGRATAFGDVAEMLAERPPPTEFERGLDGFARLIMRTVVFLLLFVLLVGIALGRPPLESLLFALALAVGLTPEFMPMITTMTLAQGAVRMAQRRVIVKHLAAIEDFGSMTVLLCDKTGTLTGGETMVAAVLDPAGKAAERPLLLAFLNSAFETGIHSPLDSAILRHGKVDIAGYRKLDEIPFDFERRRLCIVVERGAERLLVVKGAPEAVLAECAQYERNGSLYALDSSARSDCTKVYETISAQGLRVLAVAYRHVPAQMRYSADDENNLVLAGFLSFADIITPDVEDALAALAADGVRVKILTGDNERVAHHVCTQAGLDTGRIVLGMEIDGLNEPELGLLAERTTVFARVSPAQKHRILLALKKRDHVVGFLGDGINDAPSLHAADVGISVAGAVDVAKDAADIVLRERDLRILHAGVIEGRKAFANVMKYLLMGTSSNFGNMFSMAAGMLFLPFLPMLPTQILLNNFLYDFAQTTIPTDNVDPAQIRRPARWNMTLIRRFMLGVGPISSLFDFLTFYVLLHWLQAPAALFHTGWFVESLATQTLVLFVIRTRGNPLHSRPSGPLVLTIAAAVAVAVALPATGLGRELGFVPLPFAFFAFLAGATVVYLLVVELAKRRFLR